MIVVGVAEECVDVRVVVITRCSKVVVVILLILLLLIAYCLCLLLNITFLLFIKRIYYY